MKTFQDNAGRIWSLCVNVAGMKRVRDMLGVNLLDVDSGLLQRLVDDPVLMGDVLYVLVQPEADRQNISNDDFGLAMGGNAFEAAGEALFQELIDFFR